MKWLINLYFVFVVLCIKSNAQPAAGTKIPDFRFTTMTGETFEPKQLTTGKLLFFVFVDTDCDHCQQAVQYMSNNHLHFSKAAIYLVSMSNPARINSFMRSYGKNLIGKKNVVLLQDTYYDFISKFKPKKYPGLFLYSPNKELLFYADDEKGLYRLDKKLRSGQL